MSESKEMALQRHLREKWPNESRADWRRRLRRLEKGLCPNCGGEEWFPGAACWDCGWEAGAEQSDAD